MAVYCYVKCAKCDRHELNGPQVHIKARHPLNVLQRVCYNILFPTGRGTFSTVHRLEIPNGSGRMEQIAGDGRYTIKFEYGAPRIIKVRHVCVKSSASDAP